jgi:branched-chain amino acid transport system permease protein
VADEIRDDAHAPAGALGAQTTATSDDRFGVLSRSTLLRHTLLAIVGLGVLWLLVNGVSDYRNTQVAPIAYTACAAAGLTLLVGLSGQISLGHGAFMAVGAYTTALLQAHWTTTRYNTQLIALLAASVAVAAIFGAVVGVAAARLRGPYLAGVTLALALGLPSLSQYEKVSQHLGGSTGLNVLSPLPPTTSIDNYQWLALICGICAVITVWFLSNVSRSRVGRSFRAVRDDEVAASLCGLSVARVQVLAFVISAAAAGLAGGLLAIVSLTAGPGAFPLSLSLGLLAAVVFGGLGSMTGAVLGSILIVLLQSWSQSLTNALSIDSAKISHNMPLMVYGVVLAVAMLAAPNGLMGAVRGLRRFAGPKRSR